MRRILVAITVTAALAGTAAAAADGDRIDLRADPVYLAPDDVDRQTVGRLTYRGGYDLRSADARFGGLSGMDVSADGRRLVAVGDRGHWFTATLRHEDGRLTGVTDGEMLPLRRVDGRPITSKRNADAESLARRADGSLVVGFERFHRLRGYAAPGAAATRRRAPRSLSDAPFNGGAEALTRLADGRFLLIAEDLQPTPGIAAAWIGGEAGWRAAGYRPAPSFRPVGADTAPGGDVIVLERRFSIIGGIASRLVRVRGETVRAGAVLEGEELAILAPPLTADNFEAVAVRRGDRGELLVYILSDDNFNPLQRTLLLLFALAE